MFTDITTSRPLPAAVVYEVGFGFTRNLTDANIRCVVTSPSKLQGPAGVRVKTDKIDALHMAKLLRLKEVTLVTVPPLLQESAQDLVRTRKFARGDLMSARHRLSKPLLRHSIVYYDGNAWTGKHDEWLRTEALLRLPNTATRLAFDIAYDAAFP